MKSNVCKIKNGTKDLDMILKECEKVAVYNELTHKQSLQLRLICEEIDGMLPNIIDEFNGNFWIDFEDGVCKVNLSIKFDEFTAEKKKGLVALSKNKKNAAAVGIVGKIRSALENVFLDSDVLSSSGIMFESQYYSPDYHMAMDRNYGRDYSSFWSLEKYRGSVKDGYDADSWDELEKSVLASVADDVIVGVKGKQADIIVIKKFN